MYKKVNITENHLRILSLFSRGFDKEYYIREVQRELKISPRTAQLALDSLEKKAILESKIKGKIKTYKINKNKIAEDFFILTEQYKKICFLEMHEMIREIESKLSGNIQGVALIFGSYAKGIANKDSDLDLFIIGRYDAGKIKEISKAYGIEINLKHYPLAIFKKELRKDILIKEVLDNHIVLLNQEKFIKEVFENG